MEEVRGGGGEAANSTNLEVSNVSLSLSAKLGVKASDLVVDGSILTAREGYSVVLGWIFVVVGFDNTCGWCL